MRFWMAIGMAALAVACKSSRSNEAQAPSSECRDGVGDDVSMAAKTGAQGAKTGVLTAGAGIKQAGGAAAGLVEGGADGAKARWNEGKRETKQTANEGAADTKQAASTPRCH